MKLSELSEKLKEIFKSEMAQYTKPEFYCVLEHDGTLRIEISKMYEFVDVTFEDLEKISQLLGTKNINVGHKEARKGCETCDYGSQYMVPIYVKDYTVPLEQD